MQFKTLAMGAKKRIALIAHDSKKDDLLEWAQFNKASLARHKVYATGTTGWLLAEEIGIEVERMQSGPLGGDLQIGAKIAEGEIDFLVFFWDPLAAQPHDPDVSLIPSACGRCTSRADDGMRTESGRGDSGARCAHRRI